MTYDHQAWQAGISKGIDSLASNKTGISDVIILNPSDFENLINPFSEENH